ncbi:hypothetical protein N7541_007606 [Penicillium brevicompactum]|uniref:Uncharacterized protein n=1 Tax=Penicillium brevicompactum TaxID=5074 RepID=A0A9W9R0H1_PENBR|nr:hypothetical protein N7541_007606 [Penicillium brevicompactum]
MKFTNPWSYCPSIELNIFQPIFGEWLKKAFTSLLPKSSKPAPKPEGIDSQFMASIVDSLVDSLMESLKESFKESFKDGEEANCASDTGRNRGYNGRFSQASPQSTSAEDDINRQSSIVNQSRDTHKAQRHCHKRRVILIGRKQRHERKAAIRARDLLRDQSPESKQGPAQVSRDIRGHREWWSERTHDRSPRQKTGGTTPLGRLTQDEKNEVISWYEGLFKDEEEDEEEVDEDEDSDEDDK